MAYHRQVLCVSVPSVVVILGLYWYRRRYKNGLQNIRDNSENVENAISADTKTECKEEEIKKSETHCNLKTKASKSIAINGTSSNDDENRIFCKSAPIKIVQNGRGTSPIKQSQNQVDSEVLKTKIQDAEHKLLRSIDEDFENMSSPVNLPDSVNKRKSFYSRNVDTKDKPVVIMATTTPKISPENSFLESKYTKECEQNNNFEKYGDQLQKSSTIATDSVLAVKENSINETGALNSFIVNNNEEVTKNANEKRNVDASSPPLSLSSVQSGDSGKGSSLPRSEAQTKLTYEFFIPSSLVGQLYGRKRSHISLIKSKTNASVALRQKLYTGKLRVCVVEGTESEIQAALALIRQRLPSKRYPNLTMQRIHFALPQSVVPLSTESLLSLQLNLIEGINNDVVVSAVITGGHIFVQHPLHPTHPSLSILQKCLYDSYTTEESPLLPGIEINAVCVMPVNGVWYRVQIVVQDAEEAERCVVKFLDFGGYMNVHFNELRQIRSDFMCVPFQATECILSNVEPIDACWSVDSADILSNLTKGIVLQAQVAGYNSQNIPEVYLFACIGPNNVIFINKEMVARNLAKWVEIRD